MKQEIRLHRPIYEGAVTALSQIFNSRQHAEKVVGLFLKQQSRWGSKDRRQFAEMVYEVVRAWRRLIELSGESWSDASLEQDNYYPEKLIRRMISLWWMLNEQEPAPWMESVSIQRPLQSLSRAAAQSIPDWLDQFAEQQLGERWPKLLESMNQPAQVYLRVNTLKATNNQLANSLAENGIETRPIHEECLVLTKRQNIFQSQAYLNGWLEVQDLGSQRIAPLLAPRPGERVIDACAGAGGKTLHMAAIMKNKGRIVAMDVQQWKLDELRQRARRAGVDIVETRLIDSSKVIKRLHSTADALLLDVPCSGLGVLKRKPGTKWKLSPAHLAELAQSQAQILRDYSMMVKAGGRMVYATCSILPSENRQRVEGFLQENLGKWRLREELSHWPDQDQGDGFYACLLERE